MLSNLDATLKVMKRQENSERGNDSVMFVSWKDPFARQNKSDQTINMKEPKNATLMLRIIAISLHVVSTFLGYISFV